jgi:DNA-binding transcriptional LysR family regulator
LRALLLRRLPAAAVFLKPRIELSVDLDDRFVGAVDGFDAIVRHGQLPDNGWIAKRIAPSRRRLVASPDYLKTHGTPRTIGRSAAAPWNYLFQSRCIGLALPAVGPLVGGAARRGHAGQQRNHHAVQ